MSNNTIDLWSYQQKVDYLLDFITNMPEPSNGDSAVIITIEESGGTLDADTLASLIDKPYNAIVTDGLAYYRPVFVVPSEEFVIMYIIAVENPLALASITVNKATGAYTISGGE